MKEIPDFLSRTRLLFGDKALRLLQSSHIALFGLGGVGGFALEALVRSGVGQLTIVDKDKFEITNLNRQLLATTITIGQSKVQVAKDRALGINPSCIINAFETNFCEETTTFDFSTFDYVLDAIDSVKSKVALIKKAKLAAVPLLTCMGMGYKKDPTKIRVDDIAKTSVCPLAKVMRKALQKEAITLVPAVYSTEPPFSAISASVIPSSAFVPASAGLLMASVAVQTLIAPAL